jgi:hypothetical protein
VSRGSQREDIPWDAWERTSRRVHVRIGYGDIGYTYENLFGAYLVGAKEMIVEDPYIRVPHQISNFMRFCELVVKVGSAQIINLKVKGVRP